MELEFSGNTIRLGKELSELDRLVLRFVKILEKVGIEYVIISGYVAILFGRSRNTEDVDLFIGEMGFAKFMRLWHELEKEGFWCLNTSSPQKAYNDYLEEKLAIRLAVIDEMEPNFEVKFPKSRYNIYSLKHKIEVNMGAGKLMTSELELQIAFKLSLGSDKDFEDARHLYKIFKEHLNIELLKIHIMDLKVEKRADEVLWKKA